MLKKIFISLLVLTGTICVYAVENSTTSEPVKIKTETNVANIDTVVKDNFIKAKFASAENRFIQNNVKASYDDFYDLIQRASHDDYVLLLYCIKMAEYGFFDLSDNLIKRLDVNTFTTNYVKDIKKFYYPSSLVTPKDVIYFADAYSNIVYNNMAIETTSELINSTQVGDTDYKNYLIALGFYKSNNLQQSLKYINKAIVQNDNNINYLLLKAKILADLNKDKQALKTLEKVKKVDFKTIDFQEKIKAVEEYILYKTEKESSLKDYHLAYYYHLQGKSLLATKVLQSSVIQAKQYSPMIFALLAKIYYENNEPQKAMEFAQRSYKENHKNQLALETLADLYYDNSNYEDALEFYQKAKKQTKDISPSIGIAKTYYALKKETKSKKIYEKLLKKHTYNEELLVESLEVFPHKSDYYLPKVASIDLANNDIWLGLANLAIRDNNISMATTYLNNSFYIDSNNFKYYYYLSLVYKTKGQLEQAKQSLIKCSRLNSEYEVDVKTEQGLYEK